MQQMYSRGQKECDTRCYSNTYHRREMKLVPFFIVIDSFWIAQYIV